MDSYTRAAIRAPRGPHKPAPLALRIIGMTALFAACAFHYLVELPAMVAVILRAVGA